MAYKGLNTWDINKVIKESIVLAKWNPNLAIDWMEDLYKDLQNEQQLKLWTKSAQEINFTIDLKENCGIVKHEEYWGHQLAKSRRITIPTTNIKGNK